MIVRNAGPHIAIVAAALSTGVRNAAGRTEANHWRQRRSCRLPSASSATTSHDMSCNVKRCGLKLTATRTDLEVAKLSERDYLLVGQLQKMTTEI